MKKNLLAERGDWQTITGTMSPVMRLVHLSMRYDSVDFEEIRTALLKTRVQAYESEISIQAVRVGCKSRSGLLTNNSIIAELNMESVKDTSSIVNTYNYDLAAEIIRIRARNPRGNRNYYWSQLRSWHNKRMTWKVTQIAQHTEGTARSQAQHDFYRFNEMLLGYAVLDPAIAVCPVCQGWILRGEVPLDIATNDPPPYHVNCPHLWRTYPDKVPPSACVDLWTGE